MAGQGRSIRYSLFAPHRTSLPPGAERRARELRGEHAAGALQEAHAVVDGERQGVEGESSTLPERTIRPPRHSAYSPPRISRLVCSCTCGVPPLRLSPVGIAFFNRVACWPFVLSWRPGRTLARKRDKFPFRSHTLDRRDGHRQAFATAIHRRHGVVAKPREKGRRASKESRRCPAATRSCRRTVFARVAAGAAQALVLATTSEARCEPQFAAPRRGAGTRWGDRGVGQLSGAGRSPRLSQQPTRKHRWQYNLWCGAPASLLKCQATRTELGGCNV